MEVQEAINTDPAAQPATTQETAAARLKSFIERIERLTEEKKALAEDIREVFSEAKGSGFDVKVMREVLRLRAMDSADRAEREAILDTYRAALGL